MNRQSNKTQDFDIEEWSWKRHITVTPQFSQDLTSRQHLKTMGGQYAKIMGGGYEAVGHRYMGTMALKPLY